MSRANLLPRVLGKYRRTLAYGLCRRMVPIDPTQPVISFSFDDAPRSSFRVGGDILSSYGARASFFVALGLLGSETEVGPIATADDLTRALKEGHELGCHTFDHRDSWQTGTQEFIGSVRKNREALDRILPGSRFETFAYPIAEPRPSIKFRLEPYFTCCRGGGQEPNVGRADLNLLRSYFLDRRTKVDLDTVKRVVDFNAAARGWLIFATHDVTERPSPFGCTPGFFREVVEYAVRSGARLLPVGKAYQALRLDPSPARRGADPAPTHASSHAV